MKRIVVYINTMNASGGIERVVSNLVGRWSDKYSVILLVKDNKQSFYDLPDNMEIISIDEPLSLNMENRVQRVFSTAGNLFRTVRKLKLIIKKLRFDYLYTVTPINSLEFYLASHDIMRKMIISEHASAFAVNRIYQLIKRYIYPKAYYISVPNKMDCEVYQSWGCHTIYIPHLSTYAPQERARLDSKVLLNVGRLTSDKRQLELLRVWSQVFPKNGWVLRIVGDGEEKEKLEKEIKKLNMGDQVEMMEQTSDIQAVYKNASAFVFMSRMEGFGMVLLEAMSFGIPCISYDCPSGPRDLISNGYNGILVENGNADAMRSELQKIVNCQLKELETLGGNAFTTIKEWNNEKILSLWDGIFEG